MNYKPYVIYFTCGSTEIEFEPYVDDNRMYEISEQIASNARLVVRDERGGIVRAMFGKLEPVSARLM